MFAPWRRVQGSLSTQLTTFPLAESLVFQAPAPRASRSEHRLPSTDSGTVVCLQHFSWNPPCTWDGQYPPGKCFPGKCFYLRRSECVLGYSSEWKMLPADSETTSFRVLECFQITQLLWALLVKFHSRLFGNKCPHKILPVHWACSPGCQSISWFLFLPSFLLLTLINHILYDRDVIENLCLFSFKPHNSPFRYIFLGEEILYYDNKWGRQVSSHDSFKTGGWPALSFSHWMDTAVKDGHSRASGMQSPMLQAEREDSSWPHDMVAVTELRWFLNVMTPD